MAASARRITSLPAMGPLESNMTPHAAKDLPTLPDTPEIHDAMNALVRGCQGFAYLGPEIEAQIRAVKLLRARPDLANALGIGGA